MKITDISLRVIPDSRNEKTLEAEMFSDDVKVLASVPSGKSKGSGEAVTLSPHLALEKLEWIKSRVCNREFSTLQEFDDLLLSLDGTDDKSSLGGNLILVLSVAFTKLLAQKGGMEIYELIAKLSKTILGKFPLMFYNLIEGGVHARKGEPFQEYLFVPQTNSPSEGLIMVLKVIRGLKEEIREEYGKVEEGDEGGEVLHSHDAALGLKKLQEVQNRLGVEKARLSLDVAASTFYKNEVYKVGEKNMAAPELLSYYQLLSSNYHLLSIEDPFSEDDWEGFEKISKELGDKVWIVGDDLTTTNPKKIKEAFEKQAVNAVIIKPTQVGTISETIQASLLAKSYGWKTIVSHRSGETKDTFIADLAVGLGADGFKSGCPTQEERMVKYQRLIEIERSFK